MALITWLILALRNARHLSKTTAMVSDTETLGTFYSVALDPWGKDSSPYAASETGLPYTAATSSCKSSSIYLETPVPGYYNHDDVMKSKVCCSARTCDDSRNSIWDYTNTARHTRSFRINGFVLRP